MTAKWWSEEDTAVLATRVRQGVAYAQIARELDRTLGSIKARVLKLFPGKDRQPSQNHWTPEEEAILISCRRQGMKYSKCSQVLSDSGFFRSPASCEIRWRAELLIAPCKDDVSLFEKQDAKFQKAMRAAIAAGLENPQQYEIPARHPSTPAKEPFNREDKADGTTPALTREVCTEATDGRETLFRSRRQGEATTGPRRPMGVCLEDYPMGQGANAGSEQPKMLERAS